jgi:hypothetical protein
MTREDIANQQELLDIYRRNLAHFLYQEAQLGGEAYAPPGVVNGILEARKNIQQIKKVLRGWRVRVEDHPNDGDPSPATSPSVSLPQTPPVSIDRIRLRDILISYFNEEELRDIAFDLNIDYESLSGSGKGAKAREMIVYMINRNRYDELVDKVRELRPNLAWY